MVLKMKICGEKVNKVREDSMKEFVMYVSVRQVRNPLLSIPSSSSSEYG